MVALCEKQAELPHNPSLKDWLLHMLRRVAALIALQIAIAGRCRYCGTRLTLAHEQIAECQGGCIVRHTRFWECPACEDRTAEACVYFQDVGIWDGC